MEPVMTKPDGLPMLVRGATQRDIPLITSSWLKNFRHADHVRAVDSTVFFYNHHKILEKVLGRRSTTTLVICDPSNLDLIYGWGAAEIIDDCLVLHYVYVKKPFRDYGIGTKLVEEFLHNESPRAVIYTHCTKAGRAWMNILAQRLIKVPVLYNPYVLYGSLPGDWLYE